MVSVFQKPTPFKNGCRFGENRHYQIVSVFTKPIPLFKWVSVLQKPTPLFKWVSVLIVSVFVKPTPFKKRCRFYKNRHYLIVSVFIKPTLLNILKVSVTVEPTPYEKLKVAPVPPRSRASHVGFFFVKTDQLNSSSQPLMFGFFL
jgi:hypothetical protein